MVYLVVILVVLCSLVNGKPMGGPCSRADKLKTALQKHLPPSSDSSNANMNLLSRLLSCIQSTWGIDLGMQRSCDSKSSHQELQQTVGAAELNDSVLANSTCNTEQCHNEDPFGGGVVGGLDGDYAYGSLQSQNDGACSRD